MKIEARANAGRLRESYKFYQNGAVSNQLTDIGRGVFRVGGDSESVSVMCILVFVHATVE